MSAIKGDDPVQLSVFVSPPPLSVDEGDQMLLTRGCGVSEDRYDDETDKCREAETWGVEVVECVCNEDECNGADDGGGQILLFFLVALAAMPSLF